MYSRLISIPNKENIFLFGPRGTGKSHWVTTQFPKANYLNLLDDALYTELLAFPNVSNIGSEAHIQQKVAESYFEILEDLLLASQLPVFTRRAKRKLIAHPKFFFFDTGVFNTIRPRGPLDSESDIGGGSLESFVWQDFTALNDYLNWEYSSYYWRTRSKVKVDFVFYGPRGFKAIEVTSSSRIRPEDLSSLLTFKEDYPEADLFLIYGGPKTIPHKDIKIIPAELWFKGYSQYFE